MYTFTNSLGALSGTVLVLVLVLVGPRSPSARNFRGRYPTIFYPSVIYELRRDNVIYLLLFQRPIKPSGLAESDT
jgi:hypothetical protein